MRNGFSFAVCVFCLMLTSCGSSKPRDLIVGKWVRVGDDIPAGEDIEEFTKDGKAIHTIKGHTLTDRTYTLSEDGTSLEYKFPQGEKTTYTAAVTKDSLALVSRDGNEVLLFKRVK